VKIRLEKDAHELEVKALEYHIRAMATLAGIKELEKHLKNNKYIDNEKQTITRNIEC
jgi:hypothetical protein